MNEDRRDPDAPLDALVRAAAAAGRRVRPGHPEAEELLDHSLGLLAPEADARLRQHLAVCAECTGVVLDLQEIGASTPTRQGAPKLLAWALAATVLLCLGLLAWNLSLARGIAVAPRADLQLVDLAPLGPTPGADTERGGEHTLDVRLRPDVASLVLRLDLEDPRSFPRYGITVQGPDGRPLAHEIDAHRADDHAFLVELAARDLASPGLYHLHLDGRRGAVTTPLATYALRVQR